MTGEQLKNSILQMAVQGKLVPQDSNDEPASVLLERIREKKEELVKQGKLKKEKNPSNIYRGEDGLFYEQVGNSEPVCINDELPFDIPDSWEWVRLGSICTKDIKRGKSPKYVAKSNVYVFAQKCNVKNGGIDISLAKFLDEEHFTKYPEEEYMLHGDIIINSTGNGTLGRVGFFVDSDRVNDNVIVPDSHVTIVRSSTEMDWQYVYYAIKKYQRYLEKFGEGSTNQTELKPAVIADLMIPIPPIAEQKHIGKKVKELLPYIDQYSNARDVLEKMQKVFPNQLKKSILQEAVQGKLVPQNPADEPASMLLERIKAEKEQLVKGKKIKKDKNASTIYRGEDGLFYEQVGNNEPVCINDELPFDIPDSWEWARLGEIFAHNTGKALNSSNKEGNLLQYITTSNLYWGHFELENVKEMYFTSSEIEKCTVKKGDLLVCEGGEVGRAAIWNFDYDIRIQNHIHRLRAYQTVCTEYFYHILFLYKSIGLIGGKGIGIKGLSSNALHSLMMPIPPLAEQQRIVTKLEEALGAVKALG